ncbi:MAG: replication-associated recombination protein A [Lachnospiraceae bacterium]|uniref:replication-associated recombination protein A n=1 Tax=Roseburia sp. 1XD42-69 TaxID=2320088 RepID=UPI000EA27E2F|nr:replication-associated recombination protein A [Roseburia sp. 1XD42-69]MCI8876807.1 replication-associated recombination protein A [Lachnospiraceae bacterium]RKJ66806.1 replication-associated recombination protein A [Roseburia sp. 1XD42-69]
MDLFDYMREQNREKESPLASRLRPSDLEEVVGQQHIIGKDKLLYRAIKADKLSSILFYGPPGTGKTTLARVIANTTSAEFKQINATSAGKKDMEAVVAEAKNNQGMYGRKTILFIDEIHRFNKGQQDFLLPYVEDGTVILIGATTENPYFEVNGALISRSIIFELNSLSKEDIKTLILRAVQDEKKGMGAYNACIEDEALEFLSDISNGDARAALNAIELGILTTDRSSDGKIHITLSVAEECIQKRVVKYDKDGDNHYDTISAFIKSMRGSDPDAAVYYLARMLYAGEDIKFIARRIMICAAEDVGNADPQALVVAVAAAQAVERLGLPEARIPLCQAVSYVASAPKSNSAILAIDKAMSVVAKTKTAPIPVHLQDAHYKSAGKLGHGNGYLYAHDYPGHYVKQQYLPDGLTGEKFYEPTQNGYEAEIVSYLNSLQ